MDIRLGDILLMKTQHPCGSRRWLVLRTGADFRLRCEGCGREVMLPRSKAEHNIKSVQRPQENRSTAPVDFTPENEGGN